MGRRVALFVTKVYARILRPGLARLDPPAPAPPGDPLLAAWNQLERTIEDHVRHANLAA